MKRRYRTGGITWLGPEKAKLRIWTRPDPETGNRRQVSKIVHGDNHEVEMELLRLRLEHATPSVDGSDVTLDALIEVHLATPKRNGEERSASSRYRDRSRFRLHLRPVFGGRLADSITPQELTLHYDRLIRKRLKPNSVRLVHAMIHAAYRSGLERGLVTANPASLAHCPSNRAAAPSAPTVETVKAHHVLLAESDPELALMVRLTAGLGLRRSELVALKWNHLDFDEGTITITEGITDTPGVGRQTTATKTGRFGWAVMPVGEPLLDDLSRQHEVLEKAAANLGVEIPEDPYVFSPEPLSEVPWYSDSPTKRLKRHMEAHPDLPSLTLKDLRAFAATEVVTTGANLEAASAILRHESPQTTMKYYRAVREDRARSAALDLQQLL